MTRDDERAGGTGPREREDAAAKERERPIPDPATVESESTLRSPSGRVYRVIRTSQRDEYEERARGDADPAPGEGDADTAAADDRDAESAEGPRRPEDGGR